MSREILKKYGIKAKKALGQNFLVNESIINEISQAIQVMGQNIVEVGPGYGALTEKLFEQTPKSLHLVELDRDMIEILEKRLEAGDFASQGVDFTINNKDILKFQPEVQKYSVIANIPYYITSPILRHFLYGVKVKPENMVIMMQEDVGNKILGSGKNKSSVLSLFIEKKCNVYEIIKVAKENFIPAPKVESSVLLFESHNDYDDIDDGDFLKTIKIGFSEPRKKLLKILMKGGFEKESILKIYKHLGFDENMRAEDVDIEGWLYITKNIKK